VFHCFLCRLCSCLVPDPLQTMVLWPPGPLSPAHLVPGSLFLLPLVTRFAGPLPFGPLVPRPCARSILFFWVNNFLSCFFLFFPHRFLVSILHPYKPYSVLTKAWKDLNNKTKTTK
jgi:hypothetical protein